MGWMQISACTVVGLAFAGWDPQVVEVQTKKANCGLQWLPDDHWGGVAVALAD